ncbi:FAD-binding domain-containing protein 9 [Elsinoe fawcettii]|nr:FAD-binding domain-containing protein 9 [Elsinoe fawcettii]
MSDSVAGLSSLELYPQCVWEESKAVSRWSDTNVAASPAVSITPVAEIDLIQLIQWAAVRNCQIVAAAGGHGSFVPIDKRSIYIDMSAFAKISVDEDNRTVTIGGGVLTGALLNDLSERGLYTTLPNSNAVGVVGFVLGGGSSPFNGTLGFAIDQLIACRLITVTGEVLTLDTMSTGERAQLFSANEAAAELFVVLQSPRPELNVTLLFLRALPTAPRPGATVIMLVLSYFGPSDDAEKATAVSYDQRFVSAAISAETMTIPWSSMNSASNPLNGHGDFKENYAAWTQAIQAADVERAFDSWLNLAEHAPSAKPGSYFLLAAKSTMGTLNHDAKERLCFPRAARGFGIFVQAVPW